MHRVDRTRLKEAWASDGFVFPLDAMTAARGANYRHRLEAVESALESTGVRRNGQLNQLHAVLGFVGEIARNAHIL